MRDVSANFEGVQEFAKQIVEEICDWKKIFVEEVIYFFYEILLLVLQHAVNLSLAIKTVVWYVLNKFSKLRKNELAWQIVFIVRWDFRVELVLFIKNI